MKNTSDILIVSFDNGLKDEPALCVTRDHGGNCDVLKMEFGEQADILYQLLTEQTTKAEIKEESEDTMDLLIKIPKEIRLALINNIQLSADQQSICDLYIKQAIINGIPQEKTDDGTVLIDTDYKKKIKD